MPSPPAIGDAAMPTTLQPMAPTSLAMSRHTASWIAGSRTMPFLSAARPASNCGLIRGDQPGPRGRKRQGTREDEAQRDEARVADDELDRRSEIRRFQGTNVGRFPQRHAGVMPQARVKLVTADVDRHDMRRTARQENLGEAARRGADVEAAATGGIEAEEVQAGRELDAAARHPGVGRRRLERSAGSHAARRFDDRHAVGRDEPRRDGRPCPGTALEQPGFDQSQIGAAACRRLDRGRRDRPSGLRCRSAGDLGGPAHTGYGTDRV